MTEEINDMINKFCDSVEKRINQYELEKENAELKDYSQRMENQRENYYKEYLRLKQENEKLKEEFEKTSDGLLKIQYKLASNCDNYRSALEEIREKIKSLNKDICNNCGWYNTDNCQPNGYVCHDLIEIKNKINEVLNEG